MSNYGTQRYLAHRGDRESVMSIIIFVLVMILSLAALGAALLGLLHVLAKTNRHATHVETGGMKFRVRGETLQDVLDNIPDHFIDQGTHVLTPKNVDSGTRRTVGWLQESFGIFWVSIFYPLIKIHDFNIVADKLKQEIAGQEKLPIRERIQSEIRNAKGYLRFRFTHPLLVPNIELGKDRWKVDMILVVDIRIVNPVIVVFDYKGTVMRQVDAAISSATLDYWNGGLVIGPNGQSLRDNEGNLVKREFGYSEFVEADKGPTSDFSKVIMNLNDSTSPSLVDDGLKTRFGIEIMAAWIEEVDLSPDQKTLDDAARGVEEKRLLADARKQEAAGEQAYERLTRQGVGEGLKAIIDSLVAAGIPAVQAGIMAQEQIRTANLAGQHSKITTYIEGGSSIKPTIPIWGDKLCCGLLSWSLL